MLNHTDHEVLLSAMDIELRRMFDRLSVLIESDCEAGIITTKSRKPNHLETGCARPGKSLSTESRSCQIGGSVASGKAKDSYTYKMKISYP